MIRISIMRLKLQDSRIKRIFFRPINDKNLNYEIETHWKCAAGIRSIDYQ